MLTVDTVQSPSASRNDPLPQTSAAEPSASMPTPAQPLPPPPPLLLSPIPALRPQSARGPRLTSTSEGEIRDVSPAPIPPGQVRTEDRRYRHDSPDSMFSGRSGRDYYYYDRPPLPRDRSRSPHHERWERHSYRDQYYGRDMYYQRPYEGQWGYSPQTYYTRLPYSTGHPQAEPVARPSATMPNPHSSLIDASTQPMQPPSSLPLSLQASQPQQPEPLIHVPIPRVNSPSSPHDDYESDSSSSSSARPSIASPGPFL
ncbi:uncharacterized protein LOC134409335 [Elgaria multicarinata webbii]|uniref:uncharacterized protein LOC134409335 n=1 Tax=Elgaria multicarinata webbii TaxID=159646 RepID=UPI002FCD0B7D